MIKINYDVFLGKQVADGSLYVSPFLDKQYLQRKGPLNHNHLCVPGEEEAYWHWLTSTLELRNTDDQLQEIETLAAKKVITVQPVLKKGLLKDSLLAAQYLQSIFAPIRSGLARNEMGLKLFLKFVGPDWTDSVEGFLQTPLQLEQPALTCKITVQHGTFQSLLPPYDLDRKRKVDVLTWNPKNPMDFSIVWHLLVTISNGETYPMYFPISSLNRWKAAMESYFEKNPQAIRSPDVVIGVTNDLKGYDVSLILEDLNYLEETIKGNTSAEVLLKLSFWKTIPARETMLKTVLTGNQVELVFSGKVLSEADL